MKAYLLTAAFGYLLGSIPFGYILFRIFQGADIRQRGSGNIGATNVARSSPGLGALTLVLDAGKGYLAVYLAVMLFNRTPYGHADGMFTLMSVASLFAITGHVFPVWLKFRGGKGVATGLGSFIPIAPKAILVAMGVFAAIVLGYRYISLGSITAVALFPLIAWLLQSYGNSPLALIFIAAASGLIIAKHYQNIRRLLSGTEPRFHLRRR